MTCKQWNSTRKQIGLNESGDVLKPCPMCNGKAEMDWLDCLQGDRKFKKYYVKCTVCGLLTEAYEKTDAAGLAWQCRQHETP